MFAVVKTGGKQYTVRAGDVLRVEKLAGDQGANVTLDQVLAVGEGKDINFSAKGAKVTAEIMAQTRSKKITVFKKKRRQNYRRTNGHRQDITLLRVTGISPDGTKMVTAAPKKAAVEKESKKAAKPAAEKAKTPAADKE